MEALAAIGLVLLAIFTIGGVCGIIAVGMAASLRRRMDSMEETLQQMKYGASRPPAYTPPPERPPVETPPPPANISEPPPIPSVAQLPQLVQRLARDAAPIPEAIPIEPEPAAPESIQEKWSGIESALGKRWMTWIGAVVLILSAGFFVKYAIDNQWIGPATRIGLALAVGIATTFLGEHFLRREMRALGLGLTGAGLAIIYVALYGGYAYYKLAFLPQNIAFIGMALVTAVGLGLALRHDGMAIAILALIGGFLTPVMLSTGEDKHNLLFSYLLLLDLGTLGVAFLRRWRALDVLTFAGTAILYWGWHDKFYQPELLLPAMAWLGVFFLVFLLLPFLHHLRRRTPVTVERFLLALANGLLAFIAAWLMMRAEHRDALALIALLLAAIYLSVGILIRLRIPEDENSLFCCMTLAMLFLTLAAPLKFELDAALIAWALEAPVLLVIGYRFRYLPARVGGFIVLLLAVGRLLFWGWPAHPESFQPFWNREFGTAIFVPLAAWTFALIHRVMNKGSVPHGDRVLQAMAGIGGAFLAISLAHSELWQWLMRQNLSEFESAYYAGCAGVVIWTIGAACLLFGGVLFESKASRATALIALIVAGILGVHLYLRDIPQAFPLFLTFRFLAVFGAAVMAFIWTATILSRDEHSADWELNLANSILPLTLLLTLILLRAETFQWITARAAGQNWALPARYYKECAGVLVWTFGAVLFLLGGRRENHRAKLSLGALGFGALLAISLYAHLLPGPFRLILNFRFIASLLSVLAAFAWPAVVLRRSDDKEWNGAAVAVLYAAITYLLLLLSAEVFLFCRNYFEDARRAAYSSQMALSVVWAVYAAILLAVGFIRRRRGLRFMALGLFGLTALKLALVDIAHVEQIYRIISFVVLGILMIFASYLYHRIEKTLAAREAGEPE